MYLDFARKIRIARSREEEKTKNAHLHTGRRRHFNFENQKKVNSFRLKTGSSTIANELELNQNYYILVGIISLVMVICGIVGIVGYNHDIGWTFLGCGILLGLSLNMMVVAMMYQSKKQTHRKPSVGTEMKKKTVPYKRPVWDFPADPTLNRAITFLAYHGDSDCMKCCEQREIEERRFIREERKNISSLEGAQSSPYKALSYREAQGKPTIQKKKNYVKSAATKITVGTK